MKYNHKKIELKWQKVWEKERLYQTPDEARGGGPAFAKASARQRNFYQLVEFPYPSGNLHVGHWYAFAVPDIFARAKRMQGKNVLYPFGFDAFGLPAENAAIKRGLNPLKWTYENIDYMRRQLRTMGASFDWSREVITSDPDYYKWTQWIFLQFYKKGLAYQAETTVNWCPKDKTVLANEQVVQGKCERCGSEVEQRKMKQWMLKITDYAEKLLKGLDKLNWPGEIKEAQRNWIGRSEGAEMEFEIKNQKSKIKNIILLHGKGGSAKRNFIPWLKKILESKGYEVQAPTLPNTNEPNDLEQTKYVLKNCKFDKNTTIVGHSFGGLVALRLLGHGIKIKKVILAGTPFSGEFLDGKERPTVSEAIKRGFDFSKVKQNCESFVAVYDKNDYVVPVRDGEELAKNLNADFRLVEARERHFTSKEEPVILENLLPSVKVFTTRPDTIFGATYVVLSPEHEQIPNHKSQITNWDEVGVYINQAAKKTELQRLSEAREKTGVELKGVKAINPATKEEIPIWVADYVLGSVGTGAIMAVPAHDERDFEFARKFGLEIREVVSGGDVNKAVHFGEGKLINSGEFDGLSSEEARKKITKKFGKARVTYRMRDWVLSRQRYWGTPIPVIHCENCPSTSSGNKVHPVPEKELPVELPELEDFKPRDDGKSPLSKAKEWVKVKCPECGGDAERETDTMDTFVDSSWYFLRYADPANKKEFASKAKLKKWLPVDRYSGGAEHTTMHLLYSRFWIKAMYDLGLLDFDEPYISRMNRGLILGPDGAKMSKRAGKVVDPDELVDKLGADTVRMYLAFIGPYNEVGAYPWDPNGILGIRRFLERAWVVIASGAKQSQKKIAARPSDARNDKKLDILLHKTIKKVTEDIENFKFNTAISALMIFVNESSTQDTVHSKQQLEIFLKLLAPFAPHMTEEIWRDILGHKTSIHLEKWPEYDAELIKEDVVVVPVQINGKMRGDIEISADASEKEVKEKAMTDEKIKNYLEGKQIKKVVYVKGKIINFVV